MPENTLCYGDNLDVLQRYVGDESVDLVYLDPPFKSNQNYNVLLAEQDETRSRAQIRAFGDTWRWDVTAAEAYQELVGRGGGVSEALQAFRRFLGQSDMMAYLAMMAPRLTELRRVLKPTGSIYLHCDPTASHYLKMLMDAVFGHHGFRNEIVWHYRKWPTGKHTFQRNHDVILFYSRSLSAERTFNQLYMPRAASTLKRFGTQRIRSSFDETGQRLPSQTESRPSGGVRQDDVWNIGRVPPVKQLFPTQKPDALLERIVRASSNRGDVVLDPFCGCGTAIIAAESLGRHWMGIDITHLAVTLSKHRLYDVFNDRVTYRVVGEPASLPDAKALAAQDRHQFQWWALGLVGARPVEQKKGADKGIDGRLLFHDGLDGSKTKQIILSVKSGSVGVGDVRDLRGVLDRETAEMGVLITLKRPTKPMRGKAADVGFYDSPWGTRHPRLQIITVADLLEGKRIDCPPPGQVSATLEKAPKPEKEAHPT